VDVILSGPLSILDGMNPGDIRVVVDLKDLDLGTYQLEPQVDVLPDRVQVEAILPASVEVTIIVAPTPTPTGMPTPTSVATPQP
jgi:YbbR domain-containing protein